MDALGTDHTVVIQHIREVLKDISKKNQPGFIMSIIEGLNVEVSQEDLVEIIDQAASYAY